jgi:hypothetical protein
VEGEGPDCLLINEPGRHAPVGHGNTIPIIEHTTKNMLKMIYKVQTESYSSFVARQEVIDDFVLHANTLLERMAWADSCRSWFKNGGKAGPVTALWPGSWIHWFHTTNEPRYEDWEWSRPKGVDAWEHLGNRFSVREESDDLAWYLDKADAGYESFLY